MSIPKSAEELMNQQNEINEAPERAQQLADDPKIQSEAITEPLIEVQKSVRIVSEQPGTIVVGR